MSYISNFPGAKARPFSSCKQVKSYSFGVRFSFPFLATTTNIVQNEDTEKMCVDFQKATSENMSAQGFHPHSIFFPRELAPRPPPLPQVACAGVPPPLHPVVWIRPCKKGKTRPRWVSENRGFSIFIYLPFTHKAKMAIFVTGTIQAFKQVVCHFCR